MVAGKSVKFLWRPELLLRACTAASQQLVAADCAQLTALTIQVLRDCDIAPWVRLVFASCRNICDRNIRRITVTWSQPPVELQSEPASAANSPSLRTLTLVELPLSADSVHSLLSRCPKLEAAGWLNCGTQGGC